jgi:hypothetical protein
MLLAEGPCVLDAAQGHVDQVNEAGQVITCAVEGSKHLVQLAVLFEIV